jgi:fructose-bisphosphate aldolase class II
MKPAMAAMEAVCIDRFERFGAAGQASKIKALPLAAMAEAYAAGSLDPKVQ